MAELNRRRHYPAEPAELCPPVPPQRVAVHVGQRRCLGVPIVKNEQIDGTRLSPGAEEPSVIVLPLILPRIEPSRRHRIPLTQGRGERVQRPGTQSSVSPQPIERSRDVRPSDRADQPFVGEGKLLAPSSQPDGVAGRPLHITLVQVELVSGGVRQRVGLLAEDPRIG